MNVRFTPSYSAVLWNPPATAGVLSGLMYHVILNSNSGQLIINLTTNYTNSSLPLQPCQYYMINVTAFSSEHHGDSVVMQLMVPGGERVNNSLMHLTQSMCAHRVL